jgi:hypothetical protein
MRREARFLRKEIFFLGFVRNTSFETKTHRQQLNKTKRLSAGSNLGSDCGGGRGKGYLNGQLKLRYRVSAVHSNTGVM